MERSQPEQAFELITEHRATMFDGVPAVYSMLLSTAALADADLASLRVSTVGAQTISLSTIQGRQDRTGAPLLELWAMTEVAGLGTDTATVDDTGHHFVLDRRKDLIIAGGYDVCRAEIERVMADHPAVSMVAVGPMKDEVKGELACAYVVANEGAAITADELIDYIRDKPAACKRPRSIVFVPSLPATSTGKNMRRNLAGSVDDAPT